MRKIKKSNRSIRKARIAERKRRQREFLEALKDPFDEEEAEMDNIMEEMIEQIKKQLARQEKEKEKNNPWDQEPKNDWKKWIYNTISNEKLY